MKTRTQFALFALFLIPSVVAVFIYISQIFLIPSNSCPSGSQPRVLGNIGLGCYYNFCNMDADVATINLPQCFDEKPILIFIQNGSFTTEIIFPFCLNISVAGLLDSEFVGIFVPEGVPVSKLNTPNQLQTSFEFPDVECEYFTPERLIGNVMYSNTLYYLDLPTSFSNVREFGKSGKCYTNNLDCGMDHSYFPMDRAVNMTNNVTVIDESEADSSSRSYSISFTVPKGGDVTDVPSLPIALINVYNDKREVPSDRFSVINRIFVDFDDAADAE